jgi:hypothetical protein
MLRWHWELQQLVKPNRTEELQNFKQITFDFSFKGKAEFVGLKGEGRKHPIKGRGHLG